MDMGWFTPDWKSDDKEKRIKAVEKVIAKNDQQKLVEIAYESTYRDAGKLAVTMINDENVLGDIVLDAENSFVRDAAFKKISNKDVLIDIAKNSRDEDICLEAAVKGDVKEVIVDIAKNTWIGRYFVGEYGKIPHVRLKAVRNISDESVLVDIANNSQEDYVVRLEAIQMINDNELVLKSIVDIIRMNSESHRFEINPVLNRLFSFVAENPSILKKSDISKNDWKQLEILSKKKHVDTRSYSGSSDCHDDVGIHEDTGFNGQFPPYPK